MTTCMKLLRKFYKFKLVDAIKVRIVGGDQWWGKPKYGILGTDESHLAFVKGLEEEGKSGKDRRLSKPHVCMYVCMYVLTCTMHASPSTLKFFSRLSVFWMGQSIVRRTRRI